MSMAGYLSPLQDISAARYLNEFQHHRVWPSNLPCMVEQKFFSMAYGAEIGRFAPNFYSPRKVATGQPVNVSPFHGDQRDLVY